MAEVRHQKSRRGINHGPVIVGEKPKNMKTALKNIAVFLKPFLFSVITAILLSIASSILSIIGPNQISKLTNIILAGVKTPQNPMPNKINLNLVINIAIILLIIYDIRSYNGNINSIFISQVNR